MLRFRADRRARLRVYLNDHLAGAVGGMRLAARCRDNNPGTPLAEDLDSFLADLRQDYEALHRLITDLGMPVARAKHGAAIAAEWIGRAKLNGQLVGYSPLGRLVELEGLCAGVDTKRSLWLSLLAIRTREPALRALDLDDLLRRAEGQREALEHHRRTAAGQALGEGG